MFICCFFFQAEDGIRDLVRSRGLGDVYKRQALNYVGTPTKPENAEFGMANHSCGVSESGDGVWSCLLYTSDAADERSSVDLGGRRIIKTKTRKKKRCLWEGDKQKHSCE